jgi:hypothetical protein
VFPVRYELNFYIYFVRNSFFEIFVKDKPIFSSESMLLKYYYRKSAAAKRKSLVVILKGLGAKMH